MKSNTYSAKKTDISRKWHLIDADGKVLGRLASDIVALISGKNKVYYSPNFNCGDCVVVINTKKVVVTGNKEEDKEYHRHSRVVGNLKIHKARQVRANNANRMIYEAVKGMLPKNRLRKERLINLHLYEGAEHPHTAQVK